MQIRYIFNKVTEVFPVNRRGIYIEINYEQDAVINQLQPHVGIKNLFFAREDVKLFYDTVQNGINGGGVGIFEGIPFDIKLSHQGLTRTIRNYIDLTDGFQLSKDGAEVSTKLYQSLDWLNDRIDGFTFESLFENDENIPGITPLISWRNYFKSKFIYVPYVINTIPNYRESFMALITAVIIGTQLVKQVQVLIQKVVACIGIDPVKIATRIIIVIIEFIYTIALLGAFIFIVIDFVLLIIQPIKYHVGMLVKDLLEITCAHLGLTFSSTIWQVAPYNQWLILPEHYQLQTNENNIQSIPKIVNIAVQIGIAIVAIMALNIVGLILVILGLITGKLGNFSTAIINFVGVNFNAKIKGYISPALALSGQSRGYFNGTGGDLLRIAKQLCNGKITIRNGVLHLERRDVNIASTFYQLPDVRNDWRGFNTKEFVSTTIYRFNKDLNDKNVIDNYLGTIYQTSQIPIIVTDPILVMTKGLREVSFPLCRGINKTELSVPEEILSAMLHIIDSVINFIEDFVNTVIGIVNSIVDFFNGVILSVKNFVDGIIATIVAGLQSVINAIVSVINNAFNTIVNLINNIIITPLNVVINLIPGANPLSPIDPVTIPDIVIPPIEIPLWVFQGLFFVIAAALGLSLGLAVALLIVILKPKDEDGNPIPLIIFPNLNILLTDRLNMLMMENDMVDSPKLLMIDTTLQIFIDDRIGKLTVDNLTLISAKNIYEQFYAIDSFVPDSQGNHNQFALLSPALNKSGESNKVPFGFTDFELVKDDNKIIDNFGDPALLDSLQWHIEEDWANIDYRKKEIYTNNLKLITLEPKGN